MLRVLRAEIIKLKRAKVFSWTVAVVVFFALMSYWTVRLGNPDLEHLTWEGMLNGSPLYMAAWWGILIGSLAAAHLFGAEFSEGTASTLLTMPIRRELVVAAKMIVLAGWITVLALVSLASNAVVAVVMGAEAYSASVLSEATLQTLEVGFMIFLTLPLVALVSMMGRGYMAPMLFAGAMMAANIAAGFLGWAEWFPWSMPSTVAGGLGPPGTIITELGWGSWALLLAVFAVGLAGVFLYVNHLDDAR